MSPYVSRPSEVEAVRWTGDNFEQVLAFGATLRGTERNDGVVISLELLAGVDGAQEFVPVPVGHWIVRPVDDYDHHWPVEDDYFRRKYELKEPQ